MSKVAYESQIFVSPVEPWINHSEEPLFRTLDVVLSLLGLLFLMPLMGCIALAIAIQDGRPIFFAHRRVGQGGRSFNCLKFRSMANDAEARLADLLASDPNARAEWNISYKLKDDPRITPLGRFLRRSSLDELPQFLNVLRGDMSLVGPRPIVEAEIPLYRHRIHHYCAVRPGITGIWQISGRNDVDYRTRVAMDCLYLKSKSPMLYLWIVVATVPAVLARRGSY